MYKIPWGNGYIVVETSSDILRIRSKNMSIEVRPRTIIVHGYSSHRVGGDSRKKYIYIYFREKLREYDGKVDVSNPKHIDGYEFRYTKTYYDEYYTIVTPYSFLIEYIILTSSELGIVLSGKKKIYFEKINNTLTIYIV